MEEFKGKYVVTWVSHWLGTYSRTIWNFQGRSSRCCKCNFWGSQNRLEKDWCINLLDLSSTTSCCNSSSSIGLDVRTSFGYSSATSWSIISTSSFKSKISMTYGASIVVEIIVFLRKLRATSNSSSNSLFLCYCSKILVSFAIGAHEASCYT